MKAFSISLLLSIRLCLHAQYVFSFEEAVILADGKDPAWMLAAPVDHWGLDSLHALEGNYSLAHVYDNAHADRDYFRIRHDPWQGRDSLVLSFRIRHAYAPSSANHWQVAMLSAFVTQTEGQIRLEEGIVVGVNLQGKDDLLKCWLVREGEPKEICASGFNYQEEVGTGRAAAFRVHLMSSGTVRLFLDSLEDSEGWDTTGLLAEGMVDVIPAGRELALCYAYSAGQDRKLWLDGLHLDGSFLPDREAPRLSAWGLAGPGLLELSFTEAVQVGDEMPVEIRPDGSGFFSSGKWEVDSLELVDSLIRVWLDRDLPNREKMWLKLSGIGDGDGNVMADTLVPLMRNEAQWGDVVITELMCDPEPVVGTDLGEYVELFNRSEFDLVLEDWSVGVGTRMYNPGTVRMDAGAYAIVQDLSLPNEGAVLSLRSGEGVLIHSAAYGMPLHGPAWKKEGGWSLESPDPELLCGMEEHWAWSEDPLGGTPGRLNSIREEIRDKQAPVFLYPGLDTTGRVDLYFSESLAMGTPASSELSLFPAGAYPLSVERDDPLGKVLHLHFQVDAQNWKEFRIGMHGVSDCAGNYSGALDIRGGLPVQAVAGSLLISELMFDPAEEACEFMECYYPGPGFLDLRTLGVGLSDPHEEPERYLILSDHSRLVEPGTYLVFTKEVRSFRDFYGEGPSARWVELPDMGTMPNSEGMVTLADRSGRIIDRVIYREDMHFDAGGFHRGISLERISFGRPAMESDNWHSCATVALNGTPGRENSQAAGEGPAGGELDLEPEVFSPDNDGYRDLLQIHVSGLEAGTLVHLWITDPAGRKIRVLANSHLGGPSMAYMWDGRDESGALQAEGLYVVHLRTWHPDSGRGKGKKKAFAIIHP